MNDESFEIEKKINDEKVEILYLCFVDFNGNLRTKGMFSNELLRNLKSFFHDGISVTVNLCNNESERDEYYIIKPLPNSFKIINFINSEDKSAYILCEVLNTDLNTRKYIEKIVEIMNKSNYLPMCGHGLTFTLDNDQNKYIGNDNHCLIPSSFFNKFTLNLSKVLSNNGIDVEYYVPGGKKHNHLAFVPKNLITMTDSKILSKWITLTYATDRNIKMKFSKPSERLAPYHISLWDLKMENNLFYDPDQENEFSEIGQYFVGGILKYFDEIFSIIIGSAKKVPKIEYKCDFSYNDDNCVISSPCYYTENRKISRYGWSKRCLFRGILEEANLYLVLSAIYLAGLNGINEKINFKEYCNSKHTANSLSIEEKIDKIKKCKLFTDFFGNEIIEKLVNNLMNL